MADMYIPNTTKWTQFYLNQARGKFNTYQYAPHSYQIGGRLGKRNMSTFITPVDSHAKDESNSAKSQTVIEVTSPAEQVVKQAEALVDLEKKRKNKYLTQSGKGQNAIKRPVSQKLISSPKRRKVNTSSISKQHKVKVKSRSNSKRLKAKNTLKSIFKKK